MEMYQNHHKLITLAFPIEHESSPDLLYQYRRKASRRNLHNNVTPQAIDLLGCCEAVATPLQQGIPNRLRSLLGMLCQ